MDLKILKANIKRRRRELDISQAELAEKMGVSYQTINTWENNPPASFSEANLDKLSSVLECEKAWLKGEAVRESEEKYLKEGIVQDTQNKVSLLQSEIKRLEGKVNDKQKIIELLEKANGRLEAENLRLQEDNALLQGRLKQANKSK